MKEPKYLEGLRAFMEADLARRGLGDEDIEDVELLHDIMREPDGGEWLAGARLVVRLEDGRWLSYELSVEEGEEDEDE